MLENDQSTVLTVPVIDQNESRFNESSSDLSAESDSLRITGLHKAVWLKQGKFFRSFDFPHDKILYACLTAFQSDKLFAVIFISDMAHIYGIDGDCYTINVPFEVKKAFCCSNGLIIEKKSSETESNDNVPRFFTLFDPVADFGTVVSSSVSSISPWETMSFFPSDREVLLCLTRNIKTNCIHVYHIRYLSSSRKRAIRKSSGSRRSKRYSSLSSRTVEDSMNDTDISVSLERRLSVNLAENPITADRMIGETPNENSNNSLNQNIQNLEKQMILTSVDSIDCGELKPVKSFIMASMGKQLVVIVRPELETVHIHSYSSQTFSNETSTEGVDSISAIDAALLKSSRTGQSGERLVLLERSGQMYLYNPFFKLRSPYLQLNSSWGKSTKILSADNDKICIETEAGPHHLKIVTETKCELIVQCMRAFEYILSAVSVECLKLLWSSALILADYDHIHAFMAVILSCTVDFGPQFSHQQNFNNADISKIIASSAWDWCLNEISLEKELLDYLKTAYAILSSEYGSQIDFASIRSYILICLHLIREEYKLDVNGREKVVALGNILALHAYLARWSDEWKTFYETKLSMDKIRYVTCNVREPLANPPNIMHSLYSMWNEPRINMCTLSQLIDMPFKSDFSVTPRLITSLVFMDAFSSEAELGILLNLFEEFSLKSTDLQQYAEVIRIPLMEFLSCITAMAIGQEKKKVFELIGRQDLQKTARNETNIIEDSTYSTVDLTGGRETTQVKDVRAVTQSTAEHDALSAWDDQAEADRIAISRLIFSEDRRFYVASKLLQSSRVQTVTLVQLPEWNEHEWMMLQQVIFKRTALRTLSIAMGRAALFYSARNPLVTEKYPIPKLNFSLVIQPSNVTVSAQKNVLSEDSLSWGYFHNGVSAGLSISVDAAHLTGSWIAFNQPGTLTPQYAGFLLGLGLNGHLKKLEEWNIYNFLGPKYEYASIALLLGLAASQLGSMNLKMTKVLSVHVEALLPVGSSDLKVTRAVQSAGIVGIGLLYAGCQHRRMTEVFLNEIDASQSRSNFTSPEEEALDRNEGYRLSAGIALGLMNLGKGGISTGYTVIERLTEMALMNGNVLNSQILEQSTPGAIMAFSLIYLQSNDVSAAEKIGVPDLNQLYGHIRPDFLYLRTVARHVIMWDEIGKSRDWVERHIPASLGSTIDIETCERLDSDNIPYFHILTALCMVIGLRYASTGEQSVRDILIHYFDIVMRLSEINACNQDEAIAKQALLGNLSSLCLAVSTVMAGTGDVIVMRRLRRLYGRVQDDAPNIGFYMANQMALGILFLGGGQYAFGSTPLDIAALLISFYPLLSNNLRDHRFYLQPLRHFWALAARNRCLVVRDIRTGSPVALNVIITTNSKGDLTQKAPCLIPEIDDVVSIRTDDNSYYEINIDLKDMEKDVGGVARAFTKNQTIWVTEKSQKTKPTIGNRLAVLSDQDTVSRITQLSNGLDWIQPLTRLDLLQKRGIFTLSPEPYILPKLQTSSIDIQLILKSMAQNPRTVDDCWTLKILRIFASRWRIDDLVYLSPEFFAELKISELRR